MTMSDRLAKFDFEYAGHKVDYTKDVDGEPEVSLVFKPRSDSKGSFIWKGKESEMFEVLNKLNIQAEAKGRPVELVLRTPQQNLV